MPRREGLHGIGMVSGIQTGHRSQPYPWWDPRGEGLPVWGAWQATRADSLADSYTDLSKNGNNLGAVVAPTWNATDGWIFNGSTQYLTTTFVCQNDQSQSALAQFTNRTSPTGVNAFGSNDGSPRYFNFGMNATNSRVFPANGNFQTVVHAAITAGNVGVAGNQGYVDGSAVGATLGGWSGVASSAVWLGGRNNSGALDGPIAFYCRAFVIYDEALTADQVFAVATAMATI